MNKVMKIGAGVLAGFLCLAVAHVWLNIGFAKLWFSDGESEEARFRVGFLPVT